MQYSKPVLSGLLKIDKTKVLPVFRGRLEIDKTKVLPVLSGHLKIDKIKVPLKNRQNQGFDGKW